MDLNIDIVSIGIGFLSAIGMFAVYRLGQSNPKKETKKVQ